MSAATGWDVVPPTVMRDGPFGAGMCQLWIDVEPTVDLAALARSNIEPLRRMAVFDAVVNNADRKGGHLLPMPDGHVYGVDHGVCFSVEDKLRTLLWGWQGKKLTEEAVAVLHVIDAELAGSLGAALRELLTDDEVWATQRRVEAAAQHRQAPRAQGRLATGSLAAVLTKAMAPRAVGRATLPSVSGFSRARPAAIRLTPCVLGLRPTCRGSAVTVRTCRSGCATRRPER